MACDQVIDSYSESNQDGYKSLNGAGDANGQAFTMGGTARGICACKFNTWNDFDSGETTSVQARLYACTGTPGTDGTFTGSILASSAVVNYTFTDYEADYSLKTFIFTTPYTLAASTSYVVILWCTAISNINSYVKSGMDNSSPTHAGNRVSESGADNARDVCFYAYYESDWTGKINGITNPASVLGIAVADIEKVNGI